MKSYFKIVVVVLFVAFSSQTVEAKVSACVEYDAKRTIEGFKNVILTWKNPFVKNALWPEYIRLVNQGLAKAGKPALPSNQEEAIKRIMDHTVEYEFSWYDPANFENGANVDGYLDYRDQPGQESPWAVYEEDGVSVMYAKIKCCNPQKPKSEKELAKTGSNPVSTASYTTNNFYYGGGNQGGGGYDSGSNSNRIPSSWFRGNRGYNQNYNGYDSYNYPNYYLGNRVPSTWFNGNRVYGNYRPQYRPEPQHYERHQSQQHRQQPQHQQRPQKGGPAGAGKGYDAVTGSPAGAGRGYPANTGGSSGASGGYKANTGGSPSGAGGGFSANNGSNLKSASRPQVSRPSSSNRSSGGTPRGQSRPNSSRGGNYVR